MRIAIDARMMGALNTRGIGRYIEELVRALLLISTDETYVLLVRDPLSSPFRDHPRVEHIKADVPWYSWQEQLFMPGFFRQAKADFVHIPHWNIPLFYSGPIVITIHDLLLRHPATQDSAKISTRHPLIAKMKRYGYRLVLAEAIRRATTIFVPVSFVASDVKKFYPKAREIVITGEGLSNLPTPHLKKIEHEPFLLYVGSAYPHKRLDLVIEIWKNFAPKYPELSLVIGGEHDIFLKRVMDQVRDQKLPRVFFPGRLNDQELIDRYKQAEMLLFPSSNEGFGLPPLEALSVGCPVVSSDSSCLPEVLSVPGVFFFRNGDVDGMIRAIDMVLDSRAEARRQARVGGEEVRRRYTWDKVAQITRESYQHVVRSR